MVSTGHGTNDQGADLLGVDFLQDSEAHVCLELMHWQLRSQQLYTLYQDDSRLDDSKLAAVRMPMGLHAYGFILTNLIISNYKYSCVVYYIVDGGQLAI